MKASAGVSTSGRLDASARGGKLHEPARGRQRAGVAKVLIPTHKGKDLRAALVETD